MSAGALWQSDLLVGEEGQPGADGRRKVPGGARREYGAAVEQGVLGCWRRTHRRVGREKLEILRAFGLGPPSGWVLWSLAVTAAAALDGSAVKLGGASGRGCAAAAVGDAVLRRGEACGRADAPPPSVTLRVGAARRVDARMRRQRR